MLTRAIWILRWIQSKCQHLSQSLVLPVWIHMTQYYTEMKLRKKYCDTLIKKKLVVQVFSFIYILCLMKLLLSHKTITVKNVKSERNMQNQLVFHDFTVNRCAHTCSIYQKVLVAGQVTVNNLEIRTNLLTWITLIVNNCFFPSIAVDCIDNCALKKIYGHSCIFL